MVAMAALPDDCLRIWAVRVSRGWDRRIRIREHANIAKLNDSFESRWSNTWLDHLLGITNWGKTAVDYYLMPGYLYAV
jgi:hypothetical protein